MSSGTCITPLRPHEAAPLVAVHAGMSPTSRRLRYSAPTPRLTDHMVRTLTDLRPGEHEAYAAWRDGRPVGIVRWIRTSERPQSAELAVEVVDDEQGHGVGRALVAHAAARAWGAGVRTLMVSVDPHNDRVRGWLARRHARALLEDADRFVVPMHPMFQDRSTDRLGQRDDDPVGPTDVGHRPGPLELADAADQSVPDDRETIDRGLETLDLERDAA